MLRRKLIADKDAVVLSVLASGRKEPPFWPSWARIRRYLNGELSPAYAVLGLFASVGSAHDICLQKMGEEHPNVVFCGTSPGIVKTDVAHITLGARVAGWLWGLLDLLGAAQTEEESGKLHCEMLWYSTEGRWTKEKPL